MIYSGSLKPELDTRVIGTDLYTASANVISSSYYNFTFDCEFNGLEIYAYNPNKGDKVTLYVEYYAGEDLGWLRFKKFGKSFNIFPNHVNRVISFATHPIVGTRLRVDYDCKGESVDFSLNLFAFSTREIVDTSTAKQGADW